MNGLKPVLEACDGDAYSRVFNLAIGDHGRMAHQANSRVSGLSESEKKPRSDLEPHPKLLGMLRRNRTVTGQDSSDHRMIDPENFAESPGPDAVGG